MSASESSRYTVAAVVVTYNRRALLSECLDGLLSESRRPDAIYVIDNASTDGTEDLIATRYASAVTYERLPENTGGAGGFHHGMGRAYADGYDYIWVMDDDVKPERECLAQLLAQSKSSNVLVPTSTGVEAGDGGASPAGGDRVASDMPSSPNRLPAAVIVNDLTFEGTLFHRSIITAVGLPRADFFLWYDDIEYACRIIRRGCGPCLRATAAKMVRMLPSGRCRFVAWRRYYGWRNSLYVNRVYPPSTYKRLFVEARFFLSWMRRIVSGKPWEYLRLGAHAWVDSFRDPMPRRYLPPAPSRHTPANTGKEPPA
jgi:GT2 family glycosyltransferase